MEAIIIIISYWEKGQVSKTEFSWKKEVVLLKKVFLYNDFDGLPGARKIHLDLLFQYQVAIVIVTKEDEFKDWHAIFGWVRFELASKWSFAFQRLNLNCSYFYMKNINKIIS